MAKKLIAAMLMMIMLVGGCYTAMADVDSADPLGRFNETFIKDYEAMIDHLFEHHDNTGDDRVSFVLYLKYYIDGYDAMQKACDAYTVFNQERLNIIDGQDIYDEELVRMLPSTRAAYDEVNDAAWEKYQNEEMSAKEYIEYLREMYEIWKITAK